MGADRDGPGWRRLQRRRQSDIEFLEQLIAARDSHDIAALELLAKNHLPKSAPNWRRVAINRAFAANDLPPPFKIRMV